MNTKDGIAEFFGEELKGGVNDVNDFDILRAIVGKLAFKDILSLRNNLIDKNFQAIMEDSDMANCVEEFFKYNLNVAETSRKSFLHRNTLLYRIDKIYNLTGLNIRDFGDAVAFKILSLIYKLTT